MKEQAEITDDVTVNDIKEDDGSIDMKKNHNSKLYSA